MNQNFDAKKFDQILFDLATAVKPFTGERYTPGAGVQICYEHLHRYLFAAQFLKPGVTVLDLGCGIGFGSLLMAGHGAHVVAIDVDADSTATLAKIVAQHQIDSITVLNGDIEHLESLLTRVSAKIDFVVCHEVIEHLGEPLQNRLLDLVSSQRPPFCPETIFFVSTPDKELYDQQLATQNPFHAHELTRGEFMGLLERRFKNVAAFEQNTGAVNYLRHCDSKPGQPVSFFQLGWQNSQSLVPGLSSTTYPRAEYLYALASNAELPVLPSVSLLTDASNQYVRERLAIAAKELRAMQARLSDLERTAGLLLSELQISAPQEIESVVQEIQAYKDVIRRQGDKIRQAQIRAEKVGSQVRTELAEHYTKIVTELQILIGTLKPWHAMGGSLLGATPEAAALEVHRLRSYEAAMNSVGHRLLTKIGKIARAFLPVRGLRRGIGFLRALHRA